MTKAWWVIGGEYRDADFSALVLGTGKMAGPFPDERRARTEWTRLTFCPGATATTRFSIAAETIRQAPLTPSVPTLRRRLCNP